MSKEQKLNSDIEIIYEKIAKLEQEIAHLKGEMTDKDVEDAIQSGLDKELLKNSL